jgi:hypothetical protein
MRCKKCGNFVKNMTRHLSRDRCFDYKEKKEERGLQKIPRGTRAKRRRGLYKEPEKKVD